VLQEVINQYFNKSHLFSCKVCEYIHAKTYFEVN